jgi:3-methyladenine DNA glycosylase AlkD
MAKKAKAAAPAESMGAAARMALVEEAVFGARQAANVPAMRKARQAVSVKLKAASGEDVRTIGATLARVGQWWMGYEVIAAHGPALAGISLAEVEALSQGMASWEQVDTFGVLLSGAAWAQGAVSDDDVKRWARSKDLWWRRAALVSTTVLNAKSRGGKGDAKRTLMICEMLVDDREDMVVKAMSWALRSLAPWDAKAVEAFMAKHEGRLAARARRETLNKLKTGLKTPKGRVGKKK